MLEELWRRNFADTTVRSYLHGVAHFSRYFRGPPDQFGPEDIRKYQAMRFTKLKYSPNTVILRLAALRFFYIHVLKRGWSIAETPYPKKVRHLPQTNLRPYRLRPQLRSIRRPGFDFVVFRARHQRSCPAKQKY
ncbi:MAG TPA: site-specific integrase [Terracidiphilus sp.]|nr:site-specific integrase [Terracidiphilus sp.]